MKKSISFAAVFLLAFMLISCAAKSEGSTTETVIEAVPTPTPKPENKRTTASEQTVKLGDTDIKIAIRKNENPKPLYFHPHENEETSVTAMAEILKTYNGTFIELKSKGDRNIDFMIGNKKAAFDPNRIFTETGIKKAFISGSSPASIDAVTKFAKNLIDNFLNDKNLIITVHNNTDGGNLSIKTYKNNPDAAQVFENPAHDPDDFFFVTDEKFFNFLKGKGFNVALQNNEKVLDDGSLSVYCGKNKIPYINVESKHGRLSQQIEMLKAMQELVK